MSRSRTSKCWEEWGKCFCLLLVVTPVAARASGKFAVASVQCPGEAVMLVRRPVALEPNMIGECRERLIALVDPTFSSSAVSGLATLQTEATTSIQEKPGWPRTFLTFAGGPVNVAEFGDPRGLATVIQNEDGTIHALAPDGVSLPGWPIFVPAVRQLNIAISAVDLLGDPRDELLFGSRLQARSSEGDLLPGWPFIQAGSAILVGARLMPSGPVRVVGAGQLPPVPVTTAGAFVLDEMGQLLPGWPALIPKGQFARPLAQIPAVGDVTGDGIAEVVVSVLNEQQVWIFDIGGETLSGFPLEFDIRPDDPSLGDLDGDGAREIVFWGVILSLPVPRAGVVALRGDGSIMPGWPQVTDAIGNFSPAIGDVDGDGIPEVVASTVGGTGGVYVWRDDGSSLAGWPKFLDFTTFPNPPVIGDVDGDGVGDVVVTGATTILPADGVIYAWKGDGALISGFPIVIPLRPILSNAPATLADIDRDGIVDLGVTSGPGVFASKPARIHWFDLGVPYRPEGMEWPNWAHDMARTASYSPPVRRVGMEVTVTPGMLQQSLPAPPVTVVATLPDDEDAIPSSLFLDKVDGNPVERLEGTALGGQQAGRLVFQFEGEAVRNRLGGPGQHVLTFRSEVIGGVGGIQFEGEGQIVVSGEASAGGWGIQRQPGGTR